MKGLQRDRLTIIISPVIAVVDWDP